MGELKSLDVNGRILQYKVSSTFNDIDGQADFYTMFYEGTETITKRKYWLFGEKISIVKPKFIFFIDLSIEDPNYTSTEIRKRIEYKLELLGRLAELQAGKII